VKALRRKNNKLSSTTKGVDAHDDFYIDHPFVDWYRATKDILNIFFKKDRFLD